jgi:hypothetical protein
MVQHHQLRLPLPLLLGHRLRGTRCRRVWPERLAVHRQGAAVLAAEPRWASRGRETLRTGTTHRRSSNSLTPPKQGNDVNGSDEHLYRSSDNIRYTFRPHAACICQVTPNPESSQQEAYRSGHGERGRHRLVPDCHPYRCLVRFLLRSSLRGTASSVSPPEPPGTWYLQVEDTLLRWRLGRRLARPLLHSPQRQRYLHAIARALTRLQRYTTMEGLVKAYVRTAAVARLVPVRDDLIRSVVKDVSFWLRFQQLLDLFQRERTVP